MWDVSGLVPTWHLTQITKGTPLSRQIHRFAGSVPWICFPWILCSTQSRHLYIFLLGRRWWFSFALQITHENLFKNPDKNYNEWADITPKEVPTLGTEVSMLRDPEMYPNNSLIYDYLQFPPTQVIWLLIQALRPR